MVYDTVKTVMIVNHYILSDTTVRDIVLNPVDGDNYQTLQDAINLCIDYPGHRILLNPGTYQISQPLIAAKIVNGVYQQVTIDIEGYSYNRNSGTGAVIEPLFWNTFALGIQQGKSCIVKNLSFQGEYYFPSYLNQVGIDTLGFGQWNDGRTSDNQTSPYSAIVIDPFSDSTIGFNGTTVKMYDGLHGYYLPGMSRSGSTDIKISGCGISNFVVGIIDGPANQQNGELIAVTDCRIDNVKVVYAYTNAQQKANTITGLMCWGNVHTVLDGQNYGFRYGDGSTCPMVDVMNIAGSVYQLIEGYAVAFPISIKRVYAEGLFKIGSTGGNACVHFDDCQIDFQLNADGVPMPDFYCLGDNIVFTNCMLRVYNGSTFFNRIILAGRQSFYGGMMSSPPVVTDCETVYLGSQQQTVLPVLSNVLMFYSAGKLLNRNDYDSIVIVSGNSRPTVHINRSNFSGYFVTTNASAAHVGDILLTIKNYDEYPITSYRYPLGYVTAVSADTVSFFKGGVGIHDGDQLYIWGDRLKTNL